MWTLATQQLSNLLFFHDKGTPSVKKLVVFLLLVLPVLLIGAFSYQQAYRDLTANTYARRQALAYLAAGITTEKLDRLKDIGVSLATRVRFRQLVAENKWREAIEILRSVPKDFPFIERLFLATPEGTLTADIPEVASLRGQNFSHRDWYRGVSRNWEPYVSEVYRRAAAYESIPGYGWGVIVQQPTSTAFEARDVNPRRILIAYGLIFLFATSLAHIIVRAVSEREQAAREIGKLNEDLEQKAVELEAANKERNSLLTGV